MKTGSENVDACLSYFKEAAISAVALRQINGSFASSICHICPNVRVKQEQLQCVFGIAIGGC